uniref:Uncharacterized protein n=1 Tax=Arundo donax TaxID=35708 RepID=A0A0A8Y3Y7_ARUDO
MAPYVGGWHSNDVGTQNHDTT